jgi:hypothetical protein
MADTLADALSGRVETFAAADTVTPTVLVTAGAYDAADNVGGVIVLPNALRFERPTGVWHSLVVTDAADQKAVLEVFLLRRRPSGGTYTNNAGLAFSTTDLGHILARKQVAAADYLTVGSHAVASLSGLGAVVRSEDAGTLYVLIMTAGTPTYAAVTNLRCSFGFLRD